MVNNMCLIRPGFLRYIMAKNIRLLNFVATYRVLLYGNDYHKIINCFMIKK